MNWVSGRLRKTRAPHCSLIPIRGLGSEARPPGGESQTAGLGVLCTRDRGGLGTEQVPMRMHLHAVHSLLGEPTPSWMEAAQVVWGADH